MENQSKNIDLGTFTWNMENSSQEKMDNDLKIAILNFLASSSNPWINAVKPRFKSEKPIFEEIFYYIKNLPAIREVVEE
ncbi:hypothetical protein [Chryseobacterium sp.]|uniref:hypothetical protein n=1 Tax=Chryseobacterium sp. TaxID=1871047 RepID=UPI0035B1F294